MAAKVTKKTKTVATKGQDENLKKVKIMRFPLKFDISNEVPSIAGNIKFGALSPIFS